MNDLLTFVIMCVIAYPFVRAVVYYFEKQKKKEQEKIERLEKSMQALKKQVDDMFPDKPRKPIVKYEDH